MDSGLTPCELRSDDAESDWTYSRDSFDYIHLRGLCGGIKDWPVLLKQCYELASPLALPQTKLKAVWQNDTARRLHRDL